MLHIDLETYSDISIKQGVYRYVNSPEFRILLCAYGTCADDVVCLDLDNGDALPAWFVQAIQDPAAHKAAHNAAFERVCLSAHLFGWDSFRYIDPRGWHCSSVKASMSGLPGALEGAAAVLGTTAKDRRGKALIQLFSVPQIAKDSKKIEKQVSVFDLLLDSDVFEVGGPTYQLDGEEYDSYAEARARLQATTYRNTKKSHPREWDEFKTYCIGDVIAEIGVDSQCYPLSDADQSDYELDQRILDRGIPVDSDFVSAAISLDAETKEQYKRELCELTGISNARSLTELKAWFNEAGIMADDLTKAGVKELLKSEYLDDDQREALRLKALIQKTSNAKYQAIEASVCSDGRVRGLTQFAGAGRTGRWAGRIVQLQNLPQTLDTKAVGPLHTVRDCIKTRSVDLVEGLYGTTPFVLSGMIRTAFVGDLLVADYSAIEARVLAWLAGEQWRIEVFETHGKIYEASAAAMFGIPLESIGKDSEERKKGKVAELALGYQGGPNALLTMGALGMGLAEAELPGIVSAWREANPHIVKFWYDLQRNAIAAVRGYVRVMPHGLKLYRDAGNLIIQLPSKRKLVYRDARVTTDARFGSDKLVFMGQNQETKRWEQIDTYGGKLAENVVQAASRDLLAYSLRALDAEGYYTIGHVHDEALCLKQPGQSVRQMEEIMSRKPGWAAGLPLRAAGYSAKFFQKG